MVSGMSRERLCGNVRDVPTSLRQDVSLGILRLQSDCGQVSKNTDGWPLDQQDVVRMLSAHLHHQLHREPR